MVNISLWNIFVNHKNRKIYYNWPVHKKRQQVILHGFVVLHLTKNAYWSYIVKYWDEMCIKHYHTCFGVSADNLIIQAYSGTNLRTFVQVKAFIEGLRVLVSTRQLVCDYFESTKKRFLIPSTLKLYDTSVYSWLMCLKKCLI